MADRTDEEREAARLEREQRRTGGPLAPDSVPPPQPPPAPSMAEPEQDVEDDVAVGTKRVSHRERMQSASPPVPRPARQGRRVPRGAGRRLRIGRFGALVALLLGLGVIWFLVELFQPFHGSGTGSVRVTIPSRAGASEIGDILARDGVISSSFFFDIRVTLGGDRGELRSGTYTMRRDMSYSDAIKRLTTAPKAARTTELTVIEGRTRREVDALLRSQGVRGSYLAQTRRSRVLTPHAYGAPRHVASLEGFLFPSTYQMTEPIRIGALVADQLRTFKQEFAKVDMRYARRRHLTPYDVLIVASMVEAEAATAHDRPLVASVIYNRLKDQMALALDSTTRYATGNYTTPLTQSQLNSHSPYNTRVHTGLTPTPIDNPGLAAIEAAAHPAQTNYLYFVAKPCGNGASVFTASYQQFQNAANSYQAARAKRGGRSPLHC